MHEKHRERLRKKFLKSPDILEDHEILELLLTFCIPRKNTNNVAHRLLDSFGSISGVLDASPVSLTSVEGIGEISSLFLNLIKTVFRLYIESKSKRTKKILTLDEIANLLFVKFIGRDEENVAIALFNVKKEIVFCDILEKGTTKFVDIDFRKIVSLALKYDAGYAVIAHNHPSGLAIPSREDILTTKQLNETLNMLNVKLLDHFIICDDDYVSLFSSCEIEEFDEKNTDFLNIKRAG